ncbi:MAG: T9SS type A sorting domain-containing protein [Bacteroidales bacterium]|nr:T9SS type A sorting domain-containing protein [Bacteroidales bacterium]
MSGYTIRISNSMGVVVFSQPINQPLFYVDLSTWTGLGMYFVHIIDNLSNTIEVKKIILQ